MMLSNKSLAALFLLVGLLLSGCGESEGEIAANIKFKVSSGAIVLPTSLDEDATACSDGGITAPRSRMRTSLVWSGTTEQGNLYPMVILFQMDNPRLSGKFSAGIGPVGDAETISALFGLNTDFVAPDPNIVHSSSTCFLDIGGLPKPSTALAGRQELRVRAKVMMAGVARADDGTELPFTKETETEIVYTAGSVPVSQ